MTRATCFARSALTPTSVRPCSLYQTNLGVNTVSSDTKEGYEATKGAAGEAQTKRGRREGKSVGSREGTRIEGFRKGPSYFILKPEGPFDDFEVRYEGM